MTGNVTTLGCRSVVTLLLILLPASVICQVPDAASKLRLAQALEQAGELERAAALYNDLLAKDSSNYVYFDGLQRTYVQLKRYDDAINLMRRRLARNPSDAPLRASLGGVLYIAGREKEANGEWEGVIALGPTNANLYRVVANSLTANRLLDRAIAVYRRGREACNDQNLFTLELSQLLIASMDYAGASAELLRWLEQNPVQIGFVENRMASFSAKPDGRAAAIDAVRSALRNNGNNAQLYELLAWLELEGKDYDAAFGVYKTIDGLLKLHGVGVYGFAERAFSEKAFEVAARAYQEAVGLDLPAPKVPAARYGYANCLKELSVLSDTLSRPPGGGVLPASESNPRYGGAIAAYQKIIEEFPHSEFAAKSYYQIGLIQLQHFFDLNGALSSFEQVRREVAGIGMLRHEVSLRIGEVLVARGDTAGASREFLSVAPARDAAPGQRDEAEFHLAELDYFQGHFESASQRLQALAVNLTADYANDALELQSFLRENMTSAPQALKEYAAADLLAREHRNTEAIALLQALVEKFPQAFLVDDAMMRIASLQTGAGLYADALGTYEKLLTTFRETSTSLDRAQFAVGELYESGLKDKAKAIAAYEKLLAEHPHSILVDQARKRIRRLRGDTL